MTCPTLGIVSLGIVADFRMRVVTSQAAYTCVVRVIAFATGKAIRLIANVRDTEISLDRNFSPGSVALATEV
jgi:hypothetical protein